MQLLSRASPQLGRARPFTATPLPAKVSLRCRVGKDDVNPFDNPTPNSTAKSAAPTKPKKAQQQSSSNGPSTADQDKELQLELLEASVRGNKRAQAQAKRAIQIKGMVNQPKQEDANSNLAPWREGQLLPDGWDEMPLPRKMSELYVGRRGVLFWANKIAYGAVFVLVGGWLAFRFIGPNLGLYTLQGELMPPPL